MERSASYSHPELNQRRALATAVDLYSTGGGDTTTCQVRADISTPYNGAITVTNGAVFTVTSIGEYINLQALEFSTGSGNDIDALQPAVQIWAQKGTTVSQNRADWIELTSTTAVGSPDGMGAVVPRTDIPNPLPFGPGETWTILVSFGSAKILHMQATANAIGTVHQEDPYIKINVGQGIGSGEDPFAAIGTTSAAFQGRLHYRVLKPCESMPATTKFPFPIAVKSGIDKTQLTSSVQDAFSTLLQNSTSLQRWTQDYGLTLESVDPGSDVSSENCKQYGFEAGCDIYTTQVLFEHYASLNSRDLLLDLLLKLPFEDDKVPLHVLDVDGLEITYTGVEAMFEDFEISLTGLPSGTILSPIQREYIADVVYQFIESSSAVVPHRVEVSQSARRKLIRSREAQELQELLTVATIFGLGDDANDFQRDMNAAFKSENAKFLRELQRLQFLPGPINDDADLGVIFADVTDVTVRYMGGSSRTGSSSGGNNSNETNSRQIQLIVFSISLSLSIVYLVYRVLKDFCLVKDGCHVEDIKFSEHKNGEMSRGNSSSSLSIKTSLNVDLSRQVSNSSLSGGSLHGNRDVSRPKSNSSLSGGSLHGNRDMRRQNSGSTLSVGSLHASRDMRRQNSGSTLSVGSLHETNDMRRQNSNSSLSVASMHGNVDSRRQQSNSNLSGRSLTTGESNESSQAAHEGFIHIKRGDYAPQRKVSGEDYKIDQLNRSSSADRLLPQRGAAPGGGLRKVQSGDLSLSTFARNNQVTQIDRPASMSKMGMIPTGRNGTMNQGGGGSNANAVWATTESVTKPTTTKLVKYIPRGLVNDRKSSSSESIHKSDRPNRPSSAERSLPQRGAATAPTDGGGLRKVQSGDLSLSTFARNNQVSQVGRPASMSKMGMIPTGRNGTMNQGGGGSSANAVWATTESVTAKPHTKKLVKYLPRNSSSESVDKSDRSNRSNRSTSSDRSVSKKGAAAVPTHGGGLRQSQSSAVVVDRHLSIPSSQSKEKFDLSASLSRIDAITATMQQNNATYGAPARRPGANAVWSVLSPVTESAPRKLSSKLVKHHLLSTATTTSMMMNRASHSKKNLLAGDHGHPDGTASEQVEELRTEESPPAHAMTKKKKKDRSNGSLKKNHSNSDLSYCSSSSGSGSKLVPGGHSTSSKKKKSPPTKRVDMSGLTSSLSDEQLR